MRQDDQRLRGGMVFQAYALARCFFRDKEFIVGQLAKANHIGGRKLHAIDAAMALDANQSVGDAILKEDVALGQNGQALCANRRALVADMLRQIPFFQSNAVAMPGKGA